MAQKPKISTFWPLLKKSADSSLKRSFTYETHASLSRIYSNQFAAIHYLMLTLAKVYVLWKASSPLLV